MPDLSALLLVSLGLLSAGRPTSGLEIDGLFVYGTEAGEIVGASPRDGTVFSVPVASRPVFVAHREGPLLLAKDELGGVLLFDLGSRAVRGNIHPSTPGRGDAEPVTTAGQVYLEAPGGRWVAHRTKDARVLWQTEASGLAGDSKERLYGVLGSELRALAPSTGKPLYVLPLPGSARSSPAIDADGVVAFYATPDRKKKKALIYTLAEWPHEAGAKPRFTAPLSGAPVGVPILCGSAVGLLEASPRGDQTRVFARYDRLDGRRLAAEDWPNSELAIRCAGDLFVASYRDADGRHRLVAITPAGGAIWERRDLKSFVGRFRDRFFCASPDGGLIPVSAELGASVQKDRIDIAVEVTPLPQGSAALRFVQSGEELSLPSRTAVSVRLRVYRGAVLEPSVSILAEDEAGLPPGLRLSRDGLLFGRARGLGLHVVPLSVALPGHPRASLSLALRLGPADAAR